MLDRRVGNTGGLGALFGIMVSQPSCCCCCLAPLPDSPVLLPACLLLWLCRWWSSSVRDRAPAALPRGTALPQVMDTLGKQGPHRAAEGEGVA